jgi:hypothetical protein
MSISITKAELDSLIESAVKKALESSSAFFEEKLKEQQEQIVELQNSLKKAECANNKLEQYSRRSHIRIHGLKLQRGVNCKQAVCNFINDNLKNKNKQPLGVNPFDLDAAHPLPLSQKKEDPTTTLAKQQNDRPKPERLPVIIVRFYCRDLRDAASNQEDNSRTLVSPSLRISLQRMLLSSTNFNTQSISSQHGHGKAKFSPDTRPQLPTADRLSLIFLMLDMHICSTCLNILL